MPGKVDIIGFTVQRGRMTTYYDVLFWGRAEGVVGTSQVWYRDLSWTEAMDVIYSSCDAHRPGQIEGPGGWVQPQLSADG